MSKRKRPRRDAKLPKDYDHLRLEGTKLVTPDGVVPMKPIGYGLFSDVFQPHNMPDTVVAISAGNIRDKEIAEAAKAKLPRNPHIPDVVTLGHTEHDDGVYVMPLYQAPFNDLRASKSARLDVDRLALCGLGGMLVTSTPRHNRDFVTRCVQEEGVSKSVQKALAELRRQADKVSDGFVFEFPDRNLATDKKGNLVLLDVLFDDGEITNQRAKGR